MGIHGVAEQLSHFFVANGVCSLVILELRIRQKKKEKNVKNIKEIKQICGKNKTKRP
jgi:thiamine monophosphate synthase